MKRKLPKFKLTMPHEFRTALWVSMDLIAFVLPSEVSTKTIEHSMRVSQKLSIHDKVAESVVIEFSTNDFLTAVSGLEYARLYLDGIHRHFSLPILPQICQELSDYEPVIRALQYDFQQRKRDAGL